MKKPIITEIIIWIIVLTLIIGAVLLGYNKLFVEPNIYDIEFKDIDGITKGSPVRFMGINVGYVRQLKSKDKFIDVQILITKKDMKIPNGTVARVEFYGLGGSKSIELMPPDTACDVGILTTSTIRINDVAHEAIGLVELIEDIEKFVNGYNRSKSQKVLESIKTAKDDKILKAGVNFSSMQKDIEEKLESIRLKQKDFIEKIEKMNENNQKINKFIKK